MTVKGGFERSCGNVFADLGVAEPDEALAKAKVAARIARVVVWSRMTLTQVAEVLGVDQSAVSALLRGHLRGFTTDHLTTHLTRLVVKTS
jgi:predicted XRE-type DNA-binding protein